LIDSVVHLQLLVASSQFSVVSCGESQAEGLASLDQRNASVGGALTQRLNRYHRSR
jgi:hypothetical protein